MTAVKRAGKRRSETPGSRNKNGMPATVKGRMRRNRLKQAAARLLRTHAFSDLTLEQITEQAGIPTSVFYHYFSNKAELTLELIDEVFEKFERDVTLAGPYDNLELGLLSMHNALLKLHRENAGLMRCLTEPNFADRWQQHLYSWRKMIAIGLEEFADPEYRDEKELLGIAHALSTMSESVAYELYVSRNPSLRKLLPDIDSAARFLTILWSRAVFARAPTQVDEIPFSALSHLTGRSNPVSG